MPRPRKSILFPGIRRAGPRRWRPWQANEWSWKAANRLYYRWAQRRDWKWGPSGEFSHLSSVDRKWARKAEENPAPQGLTARGARLRRRRFWDGVCGGVGLLIWGGSD